MYALALACDYMAVFLCANIMTEFDGMLLTRIFKSMAGSVDAHKLCQVWQKYASEFQLQGNNGRKGDCLLQFVEFPEAPTVVGYCETECWTRQAIVLIQQVCSYVLIQN